MNLIQALAKTDFTWTLEKSSRPYEYDPKRTQHTMLLRVVPQPGQAPIEMHFRADTDLSTEHMLSTLMKKHLQDHPVLREWLDSKGNVPVKLAIATEELEYIGSPMHTGLRKLADTKQSVITWNTLHKLHADDRVAIWKAAAKVVADAFEAAQKKGRPPLRRQLAVALRDTLTMVIDERRYTPALNEKGREEKRTELEEYALLMMYAGIALTDMEEWMWGWLGYVLEDLKVEEEAQA